MVQKILCGSDQQKRVKKLSLQRRNFLCGVELIVKGHFNADVIAKLANRTIQWEISDFSEVPN